MKNKKPLQKRMYIFCLKDIGNRFFYSLYLLHIRTEYLITYFHLSIAFSCLEIS